MRSEKLLQKIVPPVLGGGIIVILILLMNMDYPFVGHDYRYFIPRLIDTNLHLRLNGLSIQWYTPSFGGGLPAYPNPQHLEYSIVQWVSFFIGPWLAILVTTAGISFVGYYFFYRFLSEKLELDWKASTLGSLFFLGNGFFIEHMMVGHLGYQLFPLGAVILYTLFDEESKLLINVIIIAVVTAMIINQAGFYLIIILFLSFSITLPIIYLYRPQSVNWKHLAWKIVLSVVLSAALAGSKVYAVFSLMRHFPRQIFDTYNVGIIQAITGLVAQLLGVMTFIPVLMLTGQDTDLLSGGLSNITGAEYGIWEIDTGVSPLLIAFLLMWLARRFTSIQSTRTTAFESWRIPALILFGVAVWVTIELTFAKGLIYSSIKDLPILGSLHVNVRFASVFILPLVVFGTIQINRFLPANAEIHYFFILCILAVAMVLPYFFLSSAIQSRDFKLFVNDKMIRPVKLFSITRISDIADWDVFTEYASSYRPYEPLFGYSLDTFTPQTHIGSVFEQNNGYFNMTNPASLVFPEINNSYPFERIKVSDSDKLKILIQHEQPGWYIPTAQKILNVLSLVSFIFCIGTLFMTLLTTAIGKK
jgi:hypothetical protein